MTSPHVYIATDLRDGETLAQYGARVRRPMVTTRAAFVATLPGWCLAAVRGVQFYRAQS